MSSARLFVVCNVRTGKTYEGSYWSDKQLAKKRRDELNGGLSDDPDKRWNKDVGWRIAPGPDHWRYTP